MTSRVWIPGSGGMLANAVLAKALALGFKAQGTSHLEVPINDAGAVHSYISTFEPDVIINCAGRTPPAPPLEMLEANALGPHVLALFKVPLVLMSTDCVFSGRHGEANLDAKTVPSPADDYARSKVAGEVQAPHVTVVRGSFIGWQGGLLHWLSAQRGEIEGWRHAYWNGVSVDMMASALIAVASGDYWGRTVHVAANTIVSKFELLQTFVEALRLPVQIRPVDTPRCWRVLHPDLELPPVQRSIAQLVAEKKEERKRAKLAKVSVS